jgi:hypothetical protein
MAALLNVLKNGGLEARDDAEKIPQAKGAGSHCSPLDWSDLAAIEQ